MNGILQGESGSGSQGLGHPGADQRGCQVSGEGRIAWTEAATTEEGFSQT